MDAIGPYELLAVLGTGGMGVVWKARHRDTGRLAALKTLRVPAEQERRLLRLEIHALERLRHPGIVRVLEHGEHDGQPWFAMDFVDGPSLREHATRAVETLTEVGGIPASTQAAGRTWDLDEAADEPETDEATPPPASTPRGPAAGGDLPEVLSVARRLCAPLAWLHGEGLVHRDLKPENVLLVDGRQPVLVDFGLTGRAAGAGRETLDLERRVLGTAWYMAPEQIRGAPVDARADLYALGCVLYELITGRKPHDARYVSALTRLKLTVVPPPPSEWVEGVPPALDDLVMRLLAIDRRERPGFADDVAAALADLGAEDGVYDAAPRGRAYLYRPGFVGRGEALEALLARIDGRESAPSGGGLVFVAGESGAGKTRLAIELARRVARSGGRPSRADERPVSVLAGECLALGTTEAAGEPLHPLRPLLRRIAKHCRTEGLVAADRLVGSRGPVLAEFDPGFADLPGQEAWPAPADVPREVATERLFDAVTGTLEAWVAPKRLVLVLDDLQWADELTLGWLAWRARVPRDLVAVGTYRLDEAGPALRALAAGRPRVDLDRLPPPAVRAIVGDMLVAPDPPAPCVELALEHGGGNPFFVGEVLRVALAEGRIDRVDGRWVATGALADVATRLDLVPRRLAGCGPEARAFAAAGAVLGREPRWADWIALAGVDERGAVAAARELLDRDVLEQQRGLRFAHDKLREAAYDGLSAEARRELHGRAAARMDGAADRAERLAEIAFHWRAAGDLARSRACSLEAARAAAARHAYAEAARGFQAWLELAGSGDAPVWVELGAALKAVARHADAEAAWRRAIALASERGDLRTEFAALRGIGSAALERSSPRDAAPSVERALAIARELGEPGLEADALAGLAQQLRFEGRYSEARAACERAVAGYEAIGNPAALGQCLCSLAWLVARQDGQAVALGYARRALAAFEAAGDRVGQALALRMVADLHPEDDPAVVIALYEQALARYAELAHPAVEGVAYANFAIFLHRHGRPEESQRRYRRGLALFRRCGHRRYEGHALRTIGVHLLREGRLDEARATSEAALVLLEEVGDTPMAVEALRDLAWERAMAGDHAGARVRLEQALERLAIMDAPPVRVAVLGCLGRVEAECGRIPEARDRIGQALREAGDGTQRGRVLCTAARIERVAGDVAAAGAALDEAQGLLEGRERLWWACEAGQLRIATGGDASELLTEARHWLGADRYPCTYAGRAVRRLEAACG